MEPCRPLLPELRDGLDRTGHAILRHARSASESRQGQRSRRQRAGSGPRERQSPRASIGLALALAPRYKLVSEATSYKVVYSARELAYFTSYYTL